MRVTESVVRICWEGTWSPEKHKYFNICRSWQKNSPSESSHLKDLHPYVDKGGSLKEGQNKDQAGTPLSCFFQGGSANNQSLVLAYLKYSLLGTFGIEKGFPFSNSDLIGLDWLVVAMFHLRLQTLAQTQWMVIKVSKGSNQNNKRIESKQSKEVTKGNSIDDN